MTTEELEILRNSLPKNYLTELQKRTGFSKPYIFQVLDPSDKHNNDSIIDAAILLAKEEKAKAEARKNEITNL